MSQVPPIRRRWFQFGIGTMLLLVTLFCIWLAWQVRIVRERQAMRALIKEQGGVARTLKDWRPLRYPPSAPAPPVSLPPNISVPFWRQWIGDEPIADVVIRKGS